ncbi:MAG: ASKHA domain-containing protein, partial [Eubacteriales bacterium]
MEVIFRFEQGGEVRTDANVGDNLLEVARTANVVIDAPCSGNGACGKCKVRLMSGTVDGLKTLHISDEDYEAGWRLACVSTVCEDVAVMVPDIASAYQSRMKTADLSTGKEQEIFREVMENIQGAGIDFTNNFATVDVDMDEPSLDDTLPDNERLILALQQKLGLETIKITFGAMVRMASVLRENNFKIRCDGLLLAKRFVVFDVVAQSETAPMCAAAIDIGTTTVAIVLTELKTGKILAKASSGNGQIRYGADVINRILEQQKKGGIKRLQKAVIEDTINPILDLLCKTVDIGPQRIMRLSVAANTTMNHLFLGLDGDPIRMEPYIPSFFINKGMKAGYLDLHAHPQADLITAPNIGSYVGGDITAGVLATMMWNQEDFSLFIDLGTNGEIVFGNSDFMMSCACSAGPAFEGGDISCGMRATDGAIEALTVDCSTMNPT